MIKKILLCMVSISLASCVSKKEMVYFQNINTISTEPVKYEPVIQNNDILAIFVSSPTPEAANDFNMPAAAMVDANNIDVVQGLQARYQTYLVGAEGEIYFPVLGKIKVSGLTRTQTLNKLKGELEKYIKDPIITLRITNFKISVLGEVIRPNTYPVVSERITLPEALSLAGDLTIYGERKNILVIREVEGVKTYNYIDITSADFFQSPFYYLTQNDVVYVSPNQTRVNSAAVGPNTTVIITSISLVITIIALITR